MGGQDSRKFLREQGGQLATAPYGVDITGAFGNIQLDNSNILFVREYIPYSLVDPVQIPAAEGILWNPGAPAGYVVEVCFLVVNNDAGAAPVTVSVGVDVGGAGALAAPEYWMFNEVIAYPGTSGWRGPFVIGGDDDVRGIASAANDASIHFRAKLMNPGL
jgi:hypothetical protein